MSIKEIYKTLIKYIKVNQLRQIKYHHIYHSNHRCKDLDKKGILYVGSGVSGGEEGARYGPSLMPGGNAAAWPFIKEIFQVRFSQC